VADEVGFGVHMDEVEVQMVVRKILAVGDDLEEDRNAQEKALRGASGLVILVGC